MPTSPQPALQSGDTICAIASAAGGAERGVIRVSGPAAFALVGGLCADALPAARGVTQTRLSVGPGGLPVHVLRMPGPRSFTREDVLELHLPGNDFLMQTALEALLAAGARLAEPGEFIRRAFENGALDLTRVEGVLALIQAQDEAARRAASALLFGGLEERMHAMRDRLEALRALCEASLDFDEADTGHVPVAQLAALADEILERVGEALTWEARREGTWQEPWVVLAGAPNAGKSTLYNALVASEAPALVEDLAGSTRRVLLSDTAGAVEAQTPLGEADRKAQTQARAQWASADWLLWVVDARDPVWPQVFELQPGQVRIPFPFERATLLWNQIDRPGVAREPDAEWSARFAGGALALSARQGEGLSALRTHVGERLQNQSEQGSSARSLSVRHRLALAQTRQHLREARAGLDEEWPLDAVAEELRSATDALDQILGTTTPEDLLTRIFAQFCLGK